MSPPPGVILLSVLGVLAYTGATALVGADPAASRHRLVAEAERARLPA